MSKTQEELVRDLHASESRSALLREIPLDRSWVLVASVVERSKVEPKLARPILAELACGIVEFKTIDGHQWARVMDTAAHELEGAMAAQRENDLLREIGYRAQKNRGLT